jgi:hypothetical protein
MQAYVQAGSGRRGRGGSFDQFALFGIRQLEAGLPLVAVGTAEVEVTADAGEGVGLLGGAQGRYDSIAKVSLAFRKRPPVLPRLPRPV